MPARFPLLPLLLLLTACHAAFAGTPPRLVSFESGGHSRSYALYTPPSLNASSCGPLLLYLHHHHHNPDDTALCSPQLLPTACKAPSPGRPADPACEVLAEADARSFHVAALCGRGLEPTFDAGACCGDEESSSSSSSDVDAALAAVRDASARVCVDPRRVWVVGFSVGGMLAHRLACEAPDVVRGVVSVAGLLAPTSPGGAAAATTRTALADFCRGRRAAGHSGGDNIPSSSSSSSSPSSSPSPPPPLSLLEVHGTADLFLPEAGAAAAGLPALDEALGAWAELEGCGATPTNGGGRGPRVQWKRGTATSLLWPACRRSSGKVGGAGRLELVAVTHGGHEWPAGQDLNATYYALDFLERAARETYGVEPSARRPRPDDDDGVEGEGEGEGEGAGSFLLPFSASLPLDSGDAEILAAASGSARAAREAVYAELRAAGIEVDPLDVRAELRAEARLRRQHGAGASGGAGHGGSGGGGDEEDYEEEDEDDESLFGELRSLGDLLAELNAQSAAYGDARSPEDVLGRSEDEADEGSVDGDTRGADDEEDDEEDEEEDDEDEEL
jgi:poly(3-hydroxybutyrate) depolymerase